MRYQTGQETATPVDTVATYGDYADAQAAVDHLSDSGFPVGEVRLVGTGLSLVEEVTGRKGYGQAAMASAVSGAVLGVLLGWILGIFSLLDPLASALVLALWGLVIGAVAGAIVGLIGHAMTGGKRDFWSSRHLEAAGYDLQVSVDHAPSARDTLAGLS